MKIKFFLVLFVLVFTTTIIFGAIFLLIARERVAEQKERTKISLSFLFLNKIAEIMKKEQRVIPLYDVYKNNIDYFSLDSFATLYSKEHYEALRWSSRERRPGERELIVSKDVFDQICCFIVEYNAQNEEVFIYDKNNKKVNIKFNL